MDSHFAYPCTPKMCQAVSALLETAEFEKVPLPTKWEDSGLAWYRKGSTQVQLIPQMFKRDAVDPRIATQLTSKPHIAINMNDDTFRKFMQQTELEPLGEPVCRPDGLLQQYMRSNDGDPFFVELNVRNSRCHQRA